jgi:HK97 gp10 family phage protein
MAVEMQVDVHGIPELRDKLDRLDQNMRAQVDEALDFEVQAMQTRAQSLAPKRTGYLASTIFAQKVGDWSFKLGAKASYAFFVEFGTRFMQARRFLSRALELSMPGIVQHVNHAIQNAIREASS